MATTSGADRTVPAHGKIVPQLWHAGPVLAVGVQGLFATGPSGASTRRACRTAARSAGAEHRTHYSVRA